VVRTTRLRRRYTTTRRCLRRRTTRSRSLARRRPVRRRRSRLVRHEDRQSPTVATRPTTSTKDTTTSSFSRHLPAPSLIDRRRQASSHPHTRCSAAAWWLSGRALDLRFTGRARVQFPAGGFHVTYRSTQPCIPLGSPNRVLASAGAKGGILASVGWQVTLCDPIFHVSFP